MTTRIRSEAAKFLLTLVSVLVASSPAFAASLTVGIDGGTPGEQPTAVAPDPGMRVAEIYLNLDTASQEEASGFDGIRGRIQRVRLELQRCLPRLGLLREQHPHPGQSRQGVVHQ